MKDYLKNPQLIIKSIYPICLKLLLLLSKNRLHLILFIFSFLINYIFKSQGPLFYTFQSAVTAYMLVSQLSKELESFVQQNNFSFSVFYHFSIPELLEADFCCPKLCNVCLNKLNSITLHHFS